MQTKNFFSKANLDGVNPEDFHNNLKYVNLKNQFLKHLQDEIDLLAGFILKTNSGSWSTHLNDDMKKRVTELKELHYTLTIKDK